ncbi:MAG: rhomboid family intramembrane serine protease [Bacilli bacterium]|nr:rhomboid family intramembrane serine protease [Bacilli bacterium]
MSTVVMNKKDEIIMKLVHYFVTEENYTPIIVNGVKDEIWLENQNGPYRIVRINSNNIFNKEQLNYDYFKIESIVRQIKRKTLSLNVDTLNILLNVNEDLELEATKHVTPVAIFNDNLDITNQGILEAFPNINEKLLKDTTGVELIINVTKDINAKTEKENRLYERTFMPKKNIFTYLIIAICAVMFVLTSYVDGFNLANVWNGFSADVLIKMGANYAPLLKNSHEIWRLITYMFLHGSIIHILVNMYSLVALGNQIESFFGKTKFIIIYFISGIAGGLLSAAAGGVTSVGASGAIFGLLGSMLYFGFHYRAYFGQAVKMQILPVIAINLAIGFLMPNIDNWCHIGGLVGGFLATMAVGVTGKSKKSDQINGSICLVIYLGFLIYLTFFR